MDFYHQNSSFPNENGYYYSQIPYDTTYYDYSSYYPPSQITAAAWSYEYVPTQSLVAYSPCPDFTTYSINPGSIDYSVYRSVAGDPQSVDDDINFVEYDPLPYGGGYDIAQTYGKPLPPNDEICYPRSSIPRTLPSPVVQSKEVQEQEAEDDEEDDEEEEEEKLSKGETDEEEEDRSDGSGPDEEKSGEIVQFNEGFVEEKSYGSTENQMPAGYGLEAFDLCENLFGYWPCLDKMKKNKCATCGNEYGGHVDDWKRKTVDYMFGSADPYAGWTDQSGYPNRNPGYGYGQMMKYQHQQGSGLYEQADQYGQNSWFL